MLVSCKTTDHEGYKRIKDSVHFKLITIGDQSGKVLDDSYISFRVDAFNLGDELLAQKAFYRVQVSKNTLPDVVNQILLRAYQGDSLSIIGNVEQLEINQWFSPLVFEQDSQLIKLEFSITEVFSAEQLLQIRAEERLKADFEMKGQVELRRALDSLNYGDDHAWQGIYFETIRNGDGLTPKPGLTAYVHYKTYLLDGTPIDNTYNGEPFEYMVGKPDQVIRGFGLALSRMNSGGKARFLIPSELAFGERGSSSGIVAPFMGLIYEAELIEVR
ncbi:MAG: FKBP-type peptidyl-prolyl cis-trans isomerase [Salibacteraceae bacterium]